MKKIKILLFVALALALLVIVGCQQPVEQVDKGPANTETTSTTVESNTNIEEKTVSETTEDESAASEETTEDESVTSDETSEEETTESNTEETSETSASKNTEKDNVTVISIGEKGFSPIEVSINVGETVRWDNDRSGRLSKAMVLGNRECVAVKSPIMKPAESYEFTFNRPMRCTITEGITTQQIGTIIVE